MTILVEKNVFVTWFNFNCLICFDKYLKMVRNDRQINNNDFLKIPDCFLNQQKLTLALYWNDKNTDYIESRLLLLHLMLSAT